MCAYSYHYMCLCLDCQVILARTFLKVNSLCYFLQSDNACFIFLVKINKFLSSKGTSCENQKLLYVSFVIFHMCENMTIHEFFLVICHIHNVCMFITYICIYNTGTLYFPQ